MEATYHVPGVSDKMACVAAQATPRHISISLVLPAFNEEAVIEQAIREADEALREVTDDYEIVVVDDGSRDATRERALREAKCRPCVRVVTHATNQGYGAALRTGFHTATKQYVGFTDADCQFDLREIKRLVLLLDDCDIACGYRMDRQDAWHRLVYSQAYNALVRLTLGTRVRDCDCAMKLFRRDVLAELPITTDGFLINAELLTRARIAGKSVVEVGVTHRPRPRGQSTVSFLHTIPVLIALIRFWWSTVMFPACRETCSVDRVRSGRSATQAAATVLLTVCAALLLLGNLSYPFVEPDESRYAQVALEMLESGDFVVPRLLGEPYLDKPPLLYWATAGSFWLFGPGEFAGRFPAALSALLTVLATYLLGARLLGSRAACLGAWMMLLSLGFVLSGRFVVMDGPLTLFTTVCLLAMFVAVQGPGVRWSWWLTAAVACSLGILTKGLVGIVLTIPPVVALVWLDRAPSRIRLRHWFAFALVVLAITAPWFVLIGQRQGEFADHFLWKHHVLRFVSAFNHQAPWWYYVPVVLIGMFPCSLLLGPTLHFLTGRSEALRAIRTRELGALVLAAVWVLAFFSASSCKLPTYVLPAVPLLCLVQGCMFHHLLSGRYSHVFGARLAHRLPTSTMDLTAVIGLGLAIADLVLEPDRGAALVVNCLAISGASGWLLYRVVRWRASRAGAASWVTVSVTALLMMGFAFQKFVPEYALYRSVNANAARLGHTADGTCLPVIYYEWQSDGSAFCLPTDQVRRFHDNQFADLQQFVLARPRTVIVADPPHIALLQTTLGDRVAFTRCRGARGRLYVLSTPATSNALVGLRPPAAAQR